MVTSGTIGGVPEPSARRIELLRLALDELEEAGVDGLSVGQIARRAGIRTPSLYKHFTGKDDIEISLVEHGFILVTEAIDTALAEVGPERPARVAAFAAAYRGFGRAHPQLYRLMNHRPLQRSALTPGTEEAAAAAWAELVPHEHLGRSFWAWAHGLMSLELADRFPPEADLDAAWQVLIDTVIAATERFDAP